MRLPAKLEPRRGGLDSGRGRSSRIRVAYLFATFPLLTETPAQREIQVLRTLPVDLDIYSLWRGGREFEGESVRRFALWRLPLLAWLLPYWLGRRPRVFLDLIKHLTGARMPSLTNVGETLLGLVFALCYANRLSRAGQRPDLLHAAWATSPATAAQFLSGLTGIPFSMGAHAYDVFENGGDWMLNSKLRDAALVVTSSQCTRRRLLERGADPHKTVLVRRGLDLLSARRTPRAARRTPRAHRSPLRILAVGRLIEKKGYHDQLALYAALKAEGLAFEARIVGAGPLERALKRQAAELGVTGFVHFLGPLPHDAVVEQHAWADVFLFTGKVARNGDRDGLPNVISEAMAAGVVVVASAVAGVPEAVEDGRTGILITEGGTALWVSALRRLQTDDGYYERLCAGARVWVEAHYDARRNARRMLRCFEAAITPAVAANGPPFGRTSGLHK